ncbi:MAG: M99 family carboxypeptidase catalytic domain-containing protein [Thermincolia bacterium]
MLALNTAEAQPQVEVKTIAAGTKYATPMYIIKSGQPGPVFLFTGGVHGNEIAGYVAARRIAKEYRVTRGTLIVIPDVNVPAVKANRRSVSEGDLNRQFPTSKGEQAKSVLARTILDAIRPYNIQWHVDMHEGFDYYKNPKTSSVGQTIIYYPTGNNGALANKLNGELNSGIREPIRKFSVLKYPVGGSFARGTAVTLGARSFIFETSQKQTLDVRVNFQLYMVNFFLKEVGMQVPVKTEAPVPVTPVETPVDQPTTPDASVPTAPEVDTPAKNDNPSTPIEDAVTEEQPTPPPANNIKVTPSKLIRNPFTAVNKITNLMRK